MGELLGGRLGESSVGPLHWREFRPREAAFAITRDWLKNHLTMSHEQPGWETPEGGAVREYGPYLDSIVDGTPSDSPRIRRTP